MVDRVERLTNLLALLLETPTPLSLVEIAGALAGQYPDGESARRGAFERDKASLRDIGVPIETEIVAGGPYAGQTRYWIDRRRYELQDLQLEPDEMAALQVAVAATRAGAPTARDALLKLGGEVGGDPGQVVAPVPTLPVLPVLREAVAQRSVVAFDYGDVRRAVEPFGLLLRNGFWYLVGHDRVRGAQRVFRVDRIAGEVAVETGPGAFERPAGLDLRTVLAVDPKALGDDRRTARVRVEPPAAAPVVLELGEEHVVARAGDGSVEVSVPCANVEAFRAWVLGLGEHAEVLDPPDVRADLVAWLSAIAGEGRVA